VLAEIALRLPPEEAVSAARAIDDPGPRAQGLAAIVAQTTDYSLQQWVETIRVLAMRPRNQCIGDLITVLPILDTIGGESTMRSLARSIISVGRWWSNNTPNERSLHIS
jgi:hypothetical protein